LKNIPLSINRYLTQLPFVLFLIVFVVSFDANGLGGGETIVLVAIYTMTFLAFVLHMLVTPKGVVGIKTNRFLVWFFILYIAWLIIEPYTSTWFDMSRYSSWIFLLTPISFFLTTYVSPSKLQKSIMWIFYLCVGMVLFSWALLHFIVTKTRPDGPLLDANVFAGLLIFFILPPVLYYLVKTPNSLVQKKVHEYLIIYLSFGFTAFFASKSRSAIGALIIVSFFILLKIFRDYERVSLKKLTHIVLIVLISFVGMVQFSNLSSITRDLATDESFNARLLMWNTSIDIYADNNKLTGIGFGQFKEFYMRDRDLNEKASSGDHAHNDYIQFLLEGGLIQLAFFVVLSLFITFHFFRVLIIKASPPERDKTLMCFLALNLCCVYFIQATVNFIFVVTTNAILIGALLGYFNKTALICNFSFDFNRKKWFVLTGLLATGLSSILLAYHTATVFYYIEVDVENQSEMQKLYSKAQKYSKVQPRSLSLSVYKLQYNLLQLAKKKEVTLSDDEFENIRDELNKSTKNKKYSSRIVYFYAVYATDYPQVYAFLSKKFPDYKYFQMTPEQLFLKSIEYEPFILSSYKALRDIYTERGQVEKAYYLEKDKLYSRSDFIRVNVFRRVAIIKNLLSDATELGLKKEAIEYAEIYIKVDKCSIHAHLALELELPEGCSSE